MWDAFQQRLFDQNLFAVKLGLDNMRRAFAREGHPERFAPAIVVGGTNGKGTTAALLANILQDHGLRVGFYSSPHLIELRERFRINGEPAARQTVLDVGDHVIKRYADPGCDPMLTFFEITTLMGALIFRDAGVDVGIWEVGLGGRLDAVNAIEPALTIITTIDFDHQTYLGDTISAIAREKAGLVRAHVPVIMGAQDHGEATQCLDAAAPHALWAQDGTDVRSRHTHTARLAAKIYLAQAYSNDRTENAINVTRWRGRMERLNARLGDLGGPWLLDAAHNPAGAAQLFSALAHEAPAAYVIGASKDKDLEGLLGSLRTQTVPVFGVALKTARGASKEALHQTVPNLKRVGSCDRILRDARQAAGEGLVVVFGSLYLLGEVYESMGFSADDMNIRRS